MTQSSPLSDSRTTLVPVSGRADEALLARLWADRALATQRAKSALSAGLQAARDGDLATIERLVRTESWDAASDRDRHGSSALMWAAGGGHLATCKYLVDELGVPLGLFEQSLHEEGFHFVRADYTYYVRVPPGTELPWLVETIKIIAQNIKRPLGASASRSRARFRLPLIHVYPRE